MSEQDIKQSLFSQRDTIRALTAQRDELVAVLKAVMATAEKAYQECTDGHHGTLESYPSFKAAREVLKKAGALL